MCIIFPMCRITVDKNVCFGLMCVSVLSAVIKSVFKTLKKYIHKSFHNRTTSQGMLLILLSLLTSCAGMFKGSLPQTQGVIDIGGGGGKIIRSPEGYTHITALKDEDLFFAQGFAHAQDRFAQMEILRRMITGRLSEVLGERTLEMDIYYRTLELGKLSEKSWTLSSPRTKKLYESYARGVNAWIRQQEDLPVEFMILGDEPEPWTPVDSVALFKILSVALGGNSQLEIAKTWLLKTVGPEGAEEFFPTYPASECRILKEEEIPSEYLTRRDSWAAIIEELTFLSDELAGLSGDETEKIAGINSSQVRERARMGPMAGSNNWVISGEFTQSGKPLLANDPHMGASMPNIFYLNELRSDTTAVNGVTMPGIPGVLIGRNRDIAWSVTTFHGDVQDYYLEEIQNIRYLFKGEWKELDITSEMIGIKGKEPYELFIKKTHHGPLMDDILNIPGVRLSLRWTLLEPGDVSHEAVLDVGYARNWKEFKKGVAKISAPLLNFLYGDTQGNIGYLAYGKIPIRERGYGSVFTPGWSGEWEWSGYIPLEELPQVYNPVKGYIVTANNYNFPDSHRRYLGTINPGCHYRAERITALIEEKLSSGKKFSLEDMKRIQLDNRSETMLAFARQVVLIPTEDRRLKEVFIFLENWDGNLDRDSIVPTLLHYWSLFLKEKVLFPSEEEISVSSSLEILNYSRLERVTKSLKEGSKGLNDADSESLQKSVLRALHRTLDYLEAEKRDELQWGDNHKILFHHLLFSDVPLIKGYFNREAPSGGSYDTVNKSVPLYNEGMSSNHIPTLRMIVDLAREDGNAIMIPGGQSFHFQSPWYDNLIAPFSEGEYLDFSLSPEVIEGECLILR